MRWREILEQSLQETERSDNLAFWLEVAEYCEITERNCLDESVDPTETKEFFSKTYAGETTSSPNKGDIQIRVMFAGLSKGDQARIDVDYYDTGSIKSKGSFIVVKTFASVTDAKNYITLLKLTFLNIKDWITLDPNGIL